MEIREILARCDHTLLAQTATWEEIRTACDDARQFGCASVCIPASYVRPAAEYLAAPLPVCTVIGFPNGYDTTAAKCFMAEEALGSGASEIDMVVNLGWVKDRLWDRVLEELQAVRQVCGDRVLKVIIECCFLTREEKIRLCQVVGASGADYIKTSTGFGPGGATREDVALLAAHAGPRLKVKAAGGISTLEEAAELIRLGAAWLGTSRIVKAVKASGREILGQK